MIMLRDVSGLVTDKTKRIHGKCVYTKCDGGKVGAWGGGGGGSTKNLDGGVWKTRKWTT